jgi:hypothetical protein
VSVGGVVVWLILTVVIGWCGLMIWSALTQRDVFDLGDGDEDS